MKPSVGRIVHYKNTSQGCWAAIITAVNDDGSCALSVFVPRSPVDAGYDSVHEGNHAGEWHWPERV